MLCDDDNASLRRAYQFRLAVVIAVQVGVGFPVMPMLPRLLRATNTMPDAQSWPGVRQLAFGLGINIGPAVIMSTAVAYAVYVALGLPKLRRKVHRAMHTCPECEYSLVGLSCDVCPECGEPLS